MARGIGEQRGKPVAGANRKGRAEPRVSACREQHAASCGGRSALVSTRLLACVASRPPSSGSPSGPSLSPFIPRRRSSVTTRAAPTSSCSSATTSAGATPGPTATPPSARPTSTRLARAGLLVRYAFGTTPQCSPSRISMLSGRYPHATRTEDLHTPLPDGVRLLPRTLQAAATSPGTWRRPTTGPTASASSSGIRPRHASALPAFLDSAGTRPFFLWVGFHEPHRPYPTRPPSPATRPPSVALTPYLADAPGDARGPRPVLRRDRARMDADIGRMLAELERRKLPGQHAGRLPERQRRRRSHGRRGRCTTEGPGRRSSCRGRGIRAGSVYDRGLVSTVDLAPDAAGGGAG